MAYNDDTVVMEDVRIIYRNFAGKPDQFQPPNTRMFHVLLDHEVAQAMFEDGWNVKWFRQVEEGTPPQAHLPVFLKYRKKDGEKMKPPKVVLITSNNRTQLDEETVEIIDDVDISTIDLIIRPNEWELNGKSGKKAYVKSIYVTVEEDELFHKHGDSTYLPSRGGKVDDR